MGTWQASTHLLRSRHLVGVGFLLPVCGFQRWNSGWQQGLAGLNASPFNAIALIGFQLRGTDISM